MHIFYNDLLNNKINLFLTFLIILTNKNINYSNANINLNTF